MKQWECTVCGYIHTGEEPPETCPVCGADRSKFILLDQESTAQKPEKDSEDKDGNLSSETKNWRCAVCGFADRGEQPPAVCPVCGADKSKFNPINETTNAPETTTPEKAETEIRQWQCTVCGYVHDGAQPPEICPVCGADKSKFIQLKENDEATQSAAEQLQRQKHTPVKENQRQSLFNVSSLTRLVKPESPFSNLLTQFHGHPISVHIPNGVLPLAVFFTLIAVLLDSAPFAIAAKYNLIFVCLFMPVVIFTGLVDWSNRYKARMTKVFKIKMICAAIVMGISFILALWWLIQPGIYLLDSGPSVLFVLLHIIDFGAAAMAGWYGGKLVFPKK